MYKKTIETLRITQSDEYKNYLKALCWIAEGYVSRIRVQFAQKAFEMYQNETVRKIVLAYGVEHEKLEERRLLDFTFFSEHPSNEYSMDDDCLNNARHYEKTIKMLFEIK